VPCGTKSERESEGILRRTTKRRNVYKVAIAYVVAGWALAQGVAQVFPVFDVPNWIVRLIVLLIAIGFPIALLIAWAFEATPEEIKRTEVADAARQRSRSRAWLYVVVIGVAISVGLFFVGRYTAPDKQSGVTEVRAKSVAILPFENLSDEKANAYFVEGIQDEILTKLAGIGDLKVISRSSTAKYKSKPEDLRTVASELGVATVLEGSVQKAGNTVRVNVQLLDPRIDAYLWAKSYDRDLKDVFAVESEVAQEIANTLRAKLSPSQSDALATVSTRDTEAYDSFLKAEYEEHQAESVLTAELFDRAQSFYRQALARDPKLALAYSRLAYSELYWG